jgi:Arc/MetJ-type ribon-helix-helix transcriptional regulator
MRPPSDDIEISLLVKMPATLREALGRGAAARRESASQFVREAIRQALRADGVHA